MLRKLIVSGLLVLTLVACGCAVVLPLRETTAQSPTQVKHVGKGEFDCINPEGRSYDCYTDEECREYWSGYNAVIQHRFDMLKKHGWYDTPQQIVYINLWADHKELLFLGKIVAQKRMDGRIWMQMWLEVYNLQCELLDKSYKEGYTIKPEKEIPDYEPNSFELEAFGRGC